MHNNFQLVSNEITTSTTTKLTFSDGQNRQEKYKIRREGFFDNRTTETHALSHLAMEKTIRLSSF